jgi:DNA-binding CsgD family transcriptional regulator
MYLESQSFSSSHSVVFPQVDAVPLGQDSLSGLHSALQAHHPAQLLLEILDELDYGVMLIDSKSTLHYANKAAKFALQTKRVLKTSGTTLCTVRNDQADLFSKNLLSAVKGKRSLVLFGQLASSLPISFVPMTLHVNVAGKSIDSQNYIKIIIGKVSLCESISLHFFAKFFALTNAERHVLEQLSKGLNVTEIAERTSIALSTVRTQLKQIFAKTGLHTQTQLLGVLGKLPPMPTVLQPHGM